VSCYWQDIVKMRMTTAAPAALWLAALPLAMSLSTTGCRGLRASTVPLGGTHEEEPEPKKAARAGAAPSAAVAVSSKDQQAAERVDVTEVSAPAVAEPSKEPVAVAQAGAFQVKPYAVHQAWTRVVDLEFALKVGPGGSIDMRMVSHQETRFEVLGVTNGALDKLEIAYPVYTSTLTIMGASQDSPEDLAGKRYVVTFAQGKPEVRDASGAKPPKKQVDSVKDDAREPQEIEKALKELSQLAAKGQGDFSSAGAVALAGGEDEDTKISRARGRLRQLTTGSHNDKLALLDVGYTLTNAVDDKVTIEAQLSGSLSVLDAPARYQTSTLHGPMDLRSSEAGGMQGRGTIKVATSYRY
jgi:hypothetical protein